MEDFVKVLHAEYRAKAEKIKKDAISKAIRELNELVEKYNQWPEFGDRPFIAGRQCGRKEVADLQGTKISINTLIVKRMIWKIYYIINRHEEVVEQYESFREAKRFFARRGGYDAGLRLVAYAESGNNHVVAPTMTEAIRTLKTLV